MRRNAKPTLDIPVTRELILDEGFLLCASGLGCESKDCKDTQLDCQLMAFFSIVEAFRQKYQLVVDEQYQVRNFYSQKADQQKIGRDIAKLLFKWLDGRGGKVRKCATKPLPQQIVISCPSVTKPGKLDMLLCQLALASKAPIWTIDSDFDCVHQVNPDVIPLDPPATYQLLFPDATLPEKSV